MWRAVVATPTCSWSWWPMHACGELINWGDVPTGAATLFAAVAAFFGLRAYRLERQRDRERERESLRAQAESVSVYFQTTANSASELVIQNLSDQPITCPEVYLELTRAQYSALRPNEGQTPGSGEGVHVPVAGAPTLIAPQSVAELTDYADSKSVNELMTRYEGVGPVTRSAIAVIGTVPAGVRFTDASGERRWHRFPDGRLVPEEP
jgi:hypothetical protein